MKETNFNVVETEVTEYTASNGEFVKSSGDKVVLPSPEQDAIVAVRDVGQNIILETPTGLIIDEAEKRLGRSEAAYLISDGADWYTVQDSDVIRGVIPDSGLKHDWNFTEESTGPLSSIDDSAGNNDLSANGDPQIVDVDGINYGEFGGSSDELIGQPTDLTESGGYTYAFAIIPLDEDDEGIGNEDYLYWDGDVGNDGATLTQGSDISPRGWQFLHYEDGSSSSVANTDNPPGTNFQILICAFDGDKIVFEEDDVLIGENTDVSGWSEPTDEFALASRGGERYANVRIGRCLVYDQFYDSDGRSNIHNALANQFNQS